MRQFLVPVALLTGLIAVSCGSDSPVSSLEDESPTPTVQTPIDTSGGVATQGPVTRSAGQYIVGSILGISQEQRLRDNNGGVLAELMVLIAGRDGVHSTDPDDIRAASAVQPYTGPERIVKLLIITSDTRIQVRNGSDLRSTSVTALTGGKTINAVYVTDTIEDNPLNGMNRVLEIMITN
jgi:hypothetical protein